MSVLPKAFVCDTFGTLVNWRYSLTKGLFEAAQNALQASSTPVAPEHATRRRASEMTWTHWEGFAVEWHGLYVQFAAGYMPNVSNWISLDDVQLRTLETLLTAKGLDSLWTDQQKRAVASLWYQLDAWPDTANGIACLNSFGSVTSTLSNGSKQNLRELAERNAIPFTTILSSDDFKAYKPSPIVYKGAAQRLSETTGTKIETHEVAMVAAHLGDLKAAKLCGLQTIYIERPIEEEMSKQEILEMRTSGLIDIWIDDKPYEMGASGLRALVEVLSEKYGQQLDV